MKFPLSTAVPLSAALALLAVAGCATSSAPPAQSFANGVDARFQLLDANGDGKVTRAEFNAGFADRMFAIYNRGRDGVITKAEWDAVERANENRAESAFAALDANHDGKLTRAELSRGPQRNRIVNALFDRIDTNHDGVITLAEARAFGVRRAAAQDPANHP